MCHNKSGGKLAEWLHCANPASPLHTLNYTPHPPLTSPTSISSAVTLLCVTIKNELPFITVSWVICACVCSVHVHAVIVRACVHAYMDVYECKHCASVMHECCRGLLTFRFTFF
ncbi:hypothetical protein AAFF_G00300380 [Aldrovandia affinis]|uniref:Uncharacterized protein n=1 Tax=Aldrovandia affinis TaxID=143900 RepID=A0AAD7SPF8_9TELE|nr:hypothetical protein AAFF_G00300380 [Aldrovandia affinis]